MKKALIALVLAAASLSAQATVGVAIGHHTWADDGFPEVGPNEQVSVFFCVGQTDGPSQMTCALDKCLEAFKIPANAKGVKKGQNILVGGKCEANGWSTKRGHSIVMVGPKGDNEFIMSKALGYPTREIAMERVARNNFPVKKATMILDYWDNGGN